MAKNAKLGELQMCQAELRERQLFVLGDSYVMVHSLVNSSTVQHGCKCCLGSRQLRPS